MASDGRSITFLALPRQIRDLIYTFLTQKGRTYAITSANAVAIAKAFSTYPELSILSTSKVVQYEMLQALCPHNAFYFWCSGSRTSPRGIDKQILFALAALMTTDEIYIDFGRFRCDSPGVGCHDPEIKDLSEHACEIIRTCNNGERGSLRIIIRDCNHYTSPHLGLPIFDAIKDLVGLETLVIEVPEFKPDLKTLGAFLEPSLGCGDIFHGLGSVVFHPTHFLAERLDLADENTAV